VHLPQDARERPCATVDADEGATFWGHMTDGHTDLGAATATLEGLVQVQVALLEVSDEPLTKDRKGREAMLDIGHW
jgi:hypothetical protein